MDLLVYGVLCIHKNIYRVYLFSIATSGSAPSSALSLMLVLSIMLSSPLLALSIFIHLPIPIPTGLFDVHAEPPSAVLRAPSPAEMLAGYGTEYKCSGSITIVEGHRSSDI